MLGRLQEAVYRICFRRYAAFLSEVGIGALRSLSDGETHIVELYLVYTVADCLVRKRDQVFPVILVIGIEEGSGALRLEVQEAAVLILDGSLGELVGGSGVVKAYYTADDPYTVLVCRLHYLVQVVGSIDITDRFGCLVSGIETDLDLSLKIDDYRIEFGVVAYVDNVIYILALAGIKTLYAEVFYFLDVLVCYDGEGAPHIVRQAVGGKLLAQCDGFGGSLYGDHAAHIGCLGYLSTVTQCSVYGDSDDPDKKNGTQQRENGKYSLDAVQCLSVVFPI